ncbi:MAG: hypothetical protein RLZZ584_3554, partial [Pseudomonadota bacterium]
MTGSARADLEVRQLSKRYDATAGGAAGHLAVAGLSFEVARGSFFSILGPSGCGKTTLLRIVAGLEAADAGSVRVSGEDTAALAARERRVGFVFQHYALFRHMSVFENVAFGLRVRPRRLRPSRREIETRVAGLLRLVQLGQFADRTPGSLSGGQQQRVAL